MVDDDVRVIELLQITLTGRGYTVYTAFDGQAALEEIERRKPDLVVLDVRLPRKSGFQVLETIRADAEIQHLPVILISGNSSNEARIQGLRMGADDYLVKPFSPRELIMKIRRILDRVSDQKLLRVQNAMLEDEIRKQREEMLNAHSEMNRNLMKIGTVLHRAEEINGRRSMRQVFEGFVQATLTDVDIETACLFARDEQNETFAPEVWRGVSEMAILNLAIPLKSFLGQVLQMEGRTMFLDELEDYPRAAMDLGKLSAAGFTHLTPIQLNAEIVALIAGGNKRDGSALDRLDVHLLSVLARSAATAITNATAFDDVRRSFIDTTAQLVATMEARYESLNGHSGRVHDLSLHIAEHFSLAPGIRQTVAYTALLHDLGALEEYQHLFDEDRLLTDEERAELRERASYSVSRMLENSQMPEVAEAVSHLNEYWDGSGLPEGLAEDSIPLAARIVAVANAFDALTHPRPHRPAYGREDTLRIIADRARHQFDPEIVQALPEIVATWPADAYIASGEEEIGGVG